MSKTILVVDDDPVLRMLITEYLSMFGHAVEGVDCGTACLARLGTEGPLPDLLVLDLMMPDMTGFDVLRHIRNDERLRPLPVILLSANGGTEALATSAGVFPDRYVDKPFEIKSLLQTIQSLGEGR
jgi:CheY-like chemotaxis protein